MQCLINKNEVCPIELGDYTRAVDTTLGIINLIADEISNMRGMTGNDDCDKCEALNLADALLILEAIRKEYEIVPINQRACRLENIEVEKPSESSNPDDAKLVGGDVVCQLAKVYEENIGMMTPMILEELKDIAENYPDGWFEDAVKESVKQNKRNLKYVLAILKRWQVEGRGAGKKEAEHKSKYIPVN